MNNFLVDLTAEAGRNFSLQTDNMVRFSYRGRLIFSMASRQIVILTKSPQQTEIIVFVIEKKPKFSNNPA